MVFKQQIRILEWFLEVRACDWSNDAKNSAFKL